MNLYSIIYIDKCNIQRHTTVYALHKVHAIRALNALPYIASTSFHHFHGIKKIIKITKIPTLHNNTFIGMAAGFSTHSYNLPESWIDYA